MPTEIKDIIDVAIYRKPTYDLASNLTVAEMVVVCSKEDEALKEALKEAKEAANMTDDWAIVHV